MKNSLTSFLLSLVGGTLALTGCAGSLGGYATVGQSSLSRPMSLPSGDDAARHHRATTPSSELPPAARFSQAFESVHGGPAPSPSVVAPTPDGGAVVAVNFSADTRVERRTFRSRGASDGVVVAFRPDGRVRWARVIGGAGNDGVLALTVSEDGRVAAAGVVSGEVEFNRVSFTGGTRFFLAVFAADGAPQGFTQALPTSHGWSQINDLTFTADGALVAVGDFHGRLEIAGARSFESPYWNGFVARFEGHASFSRGATALDARDASLLRVAPAADGGFVVAGRFHRRVRTGVEHHHGAGGDDVVLVRYDREGEPVWSRAFGRSTDDVPHSLAVREDGEVVVGVVRSGHARAGRASPPDACLVYGFDAHGALSWWRRLSAEAADLAGSRGRVARDAPAVFGWVDAHGRLGLASFGPAGADERRLSGQLFGGHLGSSIAVATPQPGHVLLLGAGVGRASDGRRVTQGVEVVAMPLAPGGTELGLWLEAAPLASR